MQKERTPIPFLWELRNKRASLLSLVIDYGRYLLSQHFVNSCDNNVVRLCLENSAFLVNFCCLDSKVTWLFRTLMDDCGLVADPLYAFSTLQLFVSRFPPRQDDAIKHLLIWVCPWNEAAWRLVSNYWSSSSSEQPAIQTPHWRTSQTWNQKA